MVPRPEGTATLTVEGMAGALRKYQGKSYKELEGVRGP